ncbi:MAG: hypothetical protein KC457_29910, partial [Myxococcales bacterium]|nr:hypothetical protein [Myxococcales bacterium]
LALLAFSPACGPGRTTLDDEGQAGESDAVGGSEESTAGDSDSGETAAPACVDADVFEDNDLPELAAEVPWFDASVDICRVEIEGHLCGDDVDWYRVGLGTPEFTDIYLLDLDVIIEGNEWCGATESDPPGCGPWLPEQPEHTVRVRVYEAATMTLLLESESTYGRIKMKATDDAYAGELLLAVDGPAVVDYDYHLYLWLKGTDGEDECEC